MCALTFPLALIQFLANDGLCFQNVLIDPPPPPRTSGVLTPPRVFSSERPGPLRTAWSSLVLSGLHCFPSANQGGAHVTPPLHLTGSAVSEGHCDSKSWPKWCLRALQPACRQTLGSRGKSLFYTDRCTETLGTRMTLNEGPSHL